MEILGLRNKAVDFFKKYKFIFIILSAGILLMLIPDNSAESSVKQENTISNVTQIENVHEELAELLSMVKGAGNVKVMLTVSQGQQTIYQENNQNNSVQTVIITDADRNESGLIKQINGPVYLGAIILCQGANDPIVRLAVTEAVSKITGLGANQIAVLEME